MHIVDDQPGGRGGTALAPRMSVPGGPAPGSDSSVPPCWGSLSVSAGWGVNAFSLAATCGVCPSHSFCRFRFVSRQKHTTAGGSLADRQEE